MEKVRWKWRKRVSEGWRSEPPPVRHGGRRWAGQGEDGGGGEEKGS